MLIVTIIARHAARVKCFSDVIGASSKNTTARFGFHISI